MRVSVVVAAFNVETLIMRALDSVRAQTVGDWEIVVVDDASTDRTAAVVGAAARADPRIRLVRQDRNRGPAAARNRAIREAKGEWIAVLDADDAWRPERLERLLEIARRTAADLVADNLVLFDDHLQSETGMAFRLDGETVPFTAAAFFSRSNPWELGILKPVFRRELPSTVGVGYDERLRFGEDFLFFTELLFRGARAALTPEGYYVYTTPVGHLSRERAVGSRSKTSLESLMWIAATLSERYRPLITPAIRRGIGRCRRRAKRRWIAAEITRLRRQRRALNLMAFLASHPRATLRYVVTSRTWHRAFGGRPAA